MDNELLTTAELADWLKVDERTITNYRNLKDDPIPFIKLGGAIRFRRSAVEQWLKERENNQQKAQNNSTGESSPSVNDNGRESEIVS